MEVEKVSFNVDTLYARLEEQVPIESAIPLPQGRTVGSVLSVTPQLQLREARVSDAGVRLSGQLQLHLVAETGERVLYCFDAAAEFTHLIPVNGAAESMQPRIFGQLLKCACHREDDGLRLSAVLDLKVWLLQSREVGAVSAIRGAVGLESREAAVLTRRRSLLGAKAVQIRDELGVEAGTNVLESKGTVRILSSRPTAEGVALEGELFSALVLLDPEGRLKEMTVRTPFSDIVRLEGAPGEGANLAGELTGLIARVDGEALFLNGDVSVSAYGSAESRTRILSDAYDEGGTFLCHREEAMGLMYLGPVVKEDTAEGPLAVPNHMPEVQQVLYSRALPAILRLEPRPEGTLLEGVALVTTVYRCDSGLLHSFTGEIPFSLTLPGPGSLVLPLSAAAFSAVTGRGRLLQGRVDLIFAGERYEENRIPYTDDLLSGAGTQQSRGILIYAPDAGETLFDLGKRFGIPQRRLRELNGEVTEPFSGAERILIIK
ncbi:MAG: DUF3794 domain-containing protein [Clostridia bacterium]|nr:DUF3794 domain-containing protein [Clostridia bacterium]